MAKKKSSALVPDEVVMNKIVIVRGQKIMIDRDLAELYKTSTFRLNEQVKRNLKRFPPDFMFQLTEKEKDEVIANCKHLESLKFSPSLPYAFTEHGAVMLASVLNSSNAIKVNIQIVRIFIKMREMLLIHKDLLLKVEQIEKKVMNQDEKVQMLFDYLNQFITQTQKPRKKIGFKITKRVK